MKDNILEILNKSYRNHQYNPLCLKTQSVSRKKNRITGKKRKRVKEFEEWYNYHDSIRSEIEEYHQRISKKRKLDNPIIPPPPPKSSKSIELEKFEEENFSDYIFVGNSFSFNKKEEKEDMVSLDGFEEDEEIEEFDLVNHFVSNKIERIIKSFGNSYVIPSSSSFILGDISGFSDLIPTNKKYEIIVMDPNWSNKSVTRRQNYEISHHALKSQLLDLPLNKISSDDGCIILIWTTNRIHYHNFIEKELINHWNKTWDGFIVRMVKKMIWIKISGNYELLFSLENDRNKPYEHLYVIQCQSCREKCVESPFHYDNIVKKFGEMDRCFLNFPTIQHSQKPPLFDWCYEIVANKKRKSSNGLELFARNLVENVDSVGNEVLKFQNLKYFLGK